METRPPDDAADGDDPTGGADLTRRMLTWLPVAALAGALAGLVATLLGGDWRLIPMGAAAAAVLVGALLAAVEDGRVQRRVERLRRPPA